MEIQTALSLRMHCIERDDDAAALAVFIEGLKVDVNQQINGKIETILHRTVLTDKRNCFEYLLTVPGLRLDCQDVYGDTPLIHATIRNSPYYVRRLLERGADAALCNSSGDTPLHFAKSVEICRLLFDHGCDINLLNRRGCSALHAAVAKKSLELCYVLLEHGIDATIIDNFGRTALSMAIKLELDVDLMETITLYTYDHIKEPVPLLDFIRLMTKKQLRFVFDQLLDSCSVVFFTEADTKPFYKFVIEFLSFDVEMLIKFYKRKPTIVTKIIKYCVLHSRYSVPFWRLEISWRHSVASLQFLDDNLLFDFYETLEKHIYFLHKYRPEILESLTTIIPIFLSRGFSLTFEFAGSVYKNYGDCDFFRQLLYFETDYTFRTAFNILCNTSLGHESPMGLLILQPCLIPSQCFLHILFEINPQTNMIALFDYFASRTLQDFCRQHYERNEEINARLVHVPTVPKLLELARDVTRQHIIQIFDCRKAAMFYTYVKHLPIPNVYKDILTYKRKIYVI